MLHKIKSKSLGDNGISLLLIKLIFTYIAKLVIFYVNYILAQSVFPLNWKRTRVVPISKVKRVHSINDLRPISIFPASSKIVGHILSAETYFTVPVCVSSRA